MQCNTCLYCEKANYKGAYGWCHSPLPFWANNPLPLIYKKELKGQVCNMYKKWVVEQI